MNRTAVALGIALASAALLVGPVHAQTPATKPPAKAPTFATWLQGLNWDPARRGALIAVEKNANLRGGATGLFRPPANAPAAPGPDNNFGRVSRRFGGVTVLAPATMLAYNPRPGKPDPLVNLRRSKATLYLLATLSEAQWRQIGGPEGLGCAALTPEQQAVWERIVPDPMVVEQGHGFAYEPPPGAERKPRKKIPLSPTERQAVRLRVKLMTSVDGRSTQGNKPRGVLFKKNSIYSPKISLDLADDNEYEQRPTDYGQELVREVPNRPKRSEIAFDALTRAVSLAPPAPDRPLTVGDVVDRIAKAAGIELRADRRLRGLTLLVRGDAAPAGDLLRALTFAVTGAVRRIGPDGNGRVVYLLAGEIEGRAALQARVDDWYLDARRRVEFEAEADLVRRIAAQSPLRFLRFDADEPVPFTPPLVDRVLANARDPKASTPGGVEIALADLPAAQQAPIREQAERRLQMTQRAQQGGNNYDFTVNVDRIRVSFSPWLGLVVPGVGEIDDVPLGNSRDWMPEAAEPAASPPPFSLSGQPLLLRLDAAAAAQPVVAEAKRLGASALWIETDDPAILKAAIAAGKEATLPIFAAPRLFRGPGASGTPGVNVLGETTSQYNRHRFQTTTPDWLDPDDPATIAAVTKRLANLVQTPGLAGMVLRDVLPPGYRAGTMQGAWNGDAPWFRYGAAAQIGYDLAHRLAFLREKGADPLDVVPDRISWRGGTDYLTYDQSLANDWAKWRHDRAVRRLEELRKVIRTARPDLPLLLGGEMLWWETAGTYEGASWFVTWGDSAPPPALYQTRATLLPDPAKLSKNGQLHLAVAGAQDADAIAARAAELARHAGPEWPPRPMLDLSGQSTDAALATLKALPMSPTAQENR